MPGNGMTGRSGRPPRPRSPICSYSEGHPFKIQLCNISWQLPASHFRSGRKTISRRSGLHFNPAMSRNSVRLRLHRFRHLQDLRMRFPKSGTQIRTALFLDPRLRSYPQLGLRWLHDLENSFYAVDSRGSVSTWTSGAGHTY